MTEEDLLNYNISQADENKQDVFDLMQRGVIPNYVSLLFSALLARAPIRTGRLKSSITLSYQGFGSADDIVAKIIIAPGVPYARATTTNSQGPKQQYNYRWIENTVEQISAVVADKYSKEGRFGYEIL
jgi:hypothetical protein